MWLETPLLVSNPCRLCRSNGGPDAWSGAAPPRPAGFSTAAGQHVPHLSPVWKRERVQPTLPVGALSPGFEPVCLFEVCGIQRGYCADTVSVLRFSPRLSLPPARVRVSLWSVPQALLLKPAPSRSLRTPNLFPDRRRHPWLLVLLSTPRSHTDFPNSAASASSPE